jgi:hypothetical protein
MNYCGNPVRLANGDVDDCPLPKDHEGVCHSVRWVMQQELDAALLAERRSKK